MPAACADCGWAQATEELHVSRCYLLEPLTLFCLISVMTDLEILSACALHIYNCIFDVCQQLNMNSIYDTVVHGRFGPDVWLCERAYCRDYRVVMSKGFCRAASTFAVLRLSGSFLVTYALTTQRRYCRHPAPQIVAALVRQSIAVPTIDRCYCMLFDRPEWKALCG